MTTYRIIVLFFLVQFCQSCGTFSALWNLKPNTDDYRLWPHRFVEAPPVPFRFERAPDQNLGKEMLLSIGFVQSLIPLEEFAPLYGTEALLLIRNDTILYEFYAGEEATQSVVTTFSITKSIISTLTGIAIREGLIQGLDQPVTDFFPEWKEKGFEKITIRHLLQHSSGIHFSTSVINIQSDQVQFYYGRHLRKRMENRQLTAEPGSLFDYHSANTQLMGMILEKVSGKTLSEYLEEKLWQPLGMENHAFWSTDRKDEQAVERAFCCLQATALDFAKLGRLWLQDGVWNGQQILPEGWIRQLLQYQTVPTGGYNAGFTNCNADCQFYMASGLMGQIIAVFPEKQLLILRFGEHRKHYSINFWKDILQQMSNNL